MKYREYIKTWWVNDVNKEGEITEYLHICKYHCDKRKT